MGNEREPRVQPYTCLAPSPEHKRAIDRQIGLQNYYFNELVAVHQKRRKAWRELVHGLPGVAELSDEIAVVDAAIKALYAQRNEARSAAREMVHFTEDESARMDVLKKRVKDLYAKRRLTVDAHVSRERAAQQNIPGVSALLAQIKALSPGKRQKTTNACRQQKAALEADVTRLTWQMLAARLDTLGRGAKAQEEDIWHHKPKTNVDRSGFKLRGLMPGNRSIVTDGIAQAEKTPSGPQFRPWTDDGTVRLEFTNEDTKLEVNADGGVESSRVVIVPAHPSAWDRTVPMPEGFTRKRAKRGLLRMCVGTGKERVWVELPLIMHSPLPPDARIASISIVRTSVAGAPKYECQITFLSMYARNHEIKSRKIPHWTTQPHVTNGESIGLDIGWRNEQQGLRTWAWADSRGDSGCMVLPAGDPVPAGSAGKKNREQGRLQRHKTIDIRSRLKKSDDIRAIRDTHFNDMKTTLFDGLQAFKAEMPTQLLEDVQYIKQWHDHERGKRLLQRWRSQRFPGDEVLFTFLTAWAARDQHLWQYEANNRAKAQRQRRERYRKEALRLKQYDYVFVENFDLRGAKDISAYNRGAACLSGFRSMIQTVAREIEKRDTTLIHNHCGFKNNKKKFADPTAMLLTCQNPVCTDPVFDRDLSAAKNVLGRGVTLMVNGTTPQTVVEKRLAKRLAKEAARQAKATGVQAQAQAQAQATVDDAGADSDASDISERDGAGT